VNRGASRLGRFLACDVLAILQASCRKRGFEDSNVYRFEVRDFRTDRSALAYASFSAFVVDSSTSHFGSPLAIERRGTFGLIQLYPKGRNRLAGH
jgi:hypothetical protein